ncbi:MAG: Ig-like domain-containing protein [Bacteroidaceae bacterium]|nr:Ig-like domain-containing protein [Bacteroidaceae bacterium]
MKRKLLFAMALCAIGALSGQLRAQTDVTSTYITNADFSSTTGWTTYVSDQYHSEGNGLIGTYVVTNNYTSTTDATHLATEYCFGVQCRWQTNYVAFQQTKENATLPAGAYTITYDVENTNTATTAGNSNYDNLFYAKVGETTYSDTSTEWMSGNSGWTTHTISFTIEEETTANFMISLGYGLKNGSNYASGYTPHVYVSHLAMSFAAISRPTAISLNETSLGLAIGSNSTLSVTYIPSDANTDTDITWTTSDANVATVVGGVVTAVGLGTANITATTANNVSATCAVTVTDVTPAAAPAFYSEIAAGDFYIVNAATGQFLSGAGYWGSQASLVDHGTPFTVAIGDGVYTLNSHFQEKVNTNKCYFNGTYVDGNSTDLYITPLGNGKYSIATADGSAFVSANINDKVVANTASTSNSVLAQWYFVSKEDIERTFENAKSAKPIDATFYISDANFSRNYLAAAYNQGTRTLTACETYPWEINASNYNLKGGEVGNSNGKGNFCAESYHSTFTLSQKLIVKNGMYKLRAQACENVTSPVAVVYANDETTPFNAMANGENSMSNCSAQFTAGNYYTEWITVNVTDNTLTIGVKSTSASNWCVWDNFELYYLGPTVAGEAEALPETAMTAGKWYYFDIAVDGMYNLTTTTLSDIVYTTDGTVLIENESSVTSTFAQAENAELTAGRYYVKSSSTQALTVATGAYAYNVGDATLSVADGGYTQSSTYSVTFPAAATSDPDGAAALVADSKATVNGTEVALTAVENGFSLDLGTLAASTDYVVAIPANVYGYSGQSMNEAINVTLHTPAIFDGEYCFYDANNKLFLGRGGGYGTEAVADKYGIPFTLVTDATGTSSVEFVDNTGVYLFITGTSIYTDNASTGWAIVPTTDGYYLRDAAKTVYATHDDGTFGKYLHTTTEEAVATVWSLKTKAERDAIIAAYPTDNINNVINASGVATTADAFETYLSSNYNAVDCTSSIGTATFAGAADDWTWNSSWRTQVDQPAYGTNFVEAWNATGAWTQTISGLKEGIYKLTVQGYERRKANDAATALYNAGYNVVSTFMSANGEQVRFTDWNDVEDKPTNTGGAVTAFNNGEAVNELYIYLDGTEDLTITVRKPNYIWDCWIIMNNFTLTRYEQAEATMKISDAQYATFVAPFDVAIPAEVTAFTVDGVNGSTLNMTEVTTTIPANTPVVLYKESTLASTTFYGKAIEGTPTEGLLTGVYTATPAPAGTYVLQNNDSKVGFYQVAEGEQPTVGANRAYLTAPAQGGVKAFFFDDTATAIQNVFDGVAAGEVYDLAGRKLQKLQKGVNIVNGKKVIVK